MNGAETVQRSKLPLGVLLRRYALIVVMLFLPVLGLGVLVLSTVVLTPPALCVAPRSQGDTSFEDRLQTAFPVGSSVEELLRELRRQHFRLDGDTRAVWDGQTTACIVTCTAQWRYDATSGAITMLEGDRAIACMVPGRRR